MRQETIVKTWLKFDELSEKGQAKALSDNYHINVSDDFWYESTYEDAKEINCKINGFDIDRGSYCELEFTANAEDVANAIIKNHGESCDTYKLAKAFLFESTLQSNSSYQELCNDFKKDLAEEYLSILRREYEYLTSDEAIKETIEANEIEFDADKYEGKV